MLTIKTMKDICKIHEQGLLPIAMIEELQRYFKEVVRSLGSTGTILLASFSAFCSE